MKFVTKQSTISSANGDQQFGSDDDHITPQEIAELTDWQVLQTFHLDPTVANATFHGQQELDDREKEVVKRKKKAL